MQEDKGSIDYQVQSGSQLSISAKKKNRKWLVLFFIILIVVIGVAATLYFGVFLYLKQTPQYSLYLMTKVVKNKDYDDFSKYFNVDSVIDDLLNKWIQESNKQLEVRFGDDPVKLKFAQEYIENFARENKETMKDNYKKQIEEGDNFFSYGGGLINFFLNTKVTINGIDADVIIFNKKNNKNLPLKMRKKSGYWEIYKINVDITEIQKLVGD